MFSPTFYDQRKKGEKILDVYVKTGMEKGEEEEIILQTI